MYVDPPSPVVRRADSASAQRASNTEAARPLVGNGQPPASTTAAAPRVGGPRPEASVMPRQHGPLPAPPLLSVIRPTAAASSPSFSPRPARQPRPPVLALPRVMVRRDLATCLRRLWGLPMPEEALLALLCHSLHVTGLMIRAAHAADFASAISDAQFCEQLLVCNILACCRSCGPSQCLMLYNHGTSHSALTPVTYCRLC